MKYFIIIIIIILYIIIFMFLLHQACGGFLCISWLKHTNYVIISFSQDLNFFERLNIFKINRNL